MPHDLIPAKEHYPAPEIHPVSMRAVTLFIIVQGKKPQVYYAFPIHDELL